jgi:3-dehydroquinate synthase
MFTFAISMLYDRTIDVGAYSVVITDELSRPLSRVFTRGEEFVGRAFVLMDENTHLHCFSRLSQIQGLMFQPIVIGAGEQHKQMETVSRVCKLLLENNASRYDVLINLGGGVVSDIGGFVASIYKRGIRFINIPTSLLAMTDAAIGGKTGVDLAGYKNMVGTFANPESVIVDLTFLQSLPEREWRNGVVETIKHALIGDAELWEKIARVDQSLSYDQRCDMQSWELVCQSIAVKASIIKMDPYEKSIRRYLNFGHTVGHALESWHLLHDDRIIPHGEAVAIGLVCESFISQKICGLDMETVIQIKAAVKQLFPNATINLASLNFLLSAMKKDKKSVNGYIPCVVLHEIGKVDFMQEVDPDLFLESFEYFNHF